MKSETLYKIWGYVALFIVTFVLASLCMQVAHCQTVLMPMPRQCFPDNLASGKPLAGGKIFTYQAGTSIQQATFTDATGLIQNTNPVILDAAGCASIWLTSGQAYRFVAQNSVGVQEWVTDQVSGLSTVGSASNQAVTTVAFSGAPTFVATGQYQLFKMTLTGNVISSTLSMTGITAPSIVSFEITQDNTGGRAFVFPLNVSGAATVNPVANNVTTETFFWDGTTAWPTQNNARFQAVNNTQYADTFSGTDECANIMLAHAVLAASAGGTIDATGYSLRGAQTCASGLTLGTTAGPILLKLGANTLTIPTNPGITITANTSVKISGIASSVTSGAGSTPINCTNSTTGATCVKWYGSRGGIEGATIQTPNTMQGLFLDASTGGANTNVKFNTFKDLTLVSAPSNTNDCIHLNAQDSTHLVSFNNFFNYECTDFQQAFDLTMQAAGSFGPTDNMIGPGQARLTTAAAGTGINVGQATQNNWFLGGNLSFFTTCINIGAFTTTNQNNFFGTICENDTNVVTAGANSADNHFYGVNCTVCSDSGNSNYFDNGIFSGLNLTKTGRPFSATNWAGTTANLPAATPGSLWITGGFVSPVLGRIYVGDGTGWQLNFAKRTASTDTDFWSIKDSGTLLGFAGSPLVFTEGTSAGAAAGVDACYGDSTAHAIKCSYNNGSFLPVPLGDTRDFSVSGCTTAASTDSNCTGSITISPAMATSTYIPQLTINSVSGGAFLAISITGALTTTSIPYNITCTFNCGTISTPTIYVHIHQN